MPYNQRMLALIRASVIYFNGSFILGTKFEKEKLTRHVGYPRVQYPGPPHMSIMIGVGFRADGVLTILFRHPLSFHLRLPETAPGCVCQSPRYVSSLPDCS
ncbi:hypothetical protein GGD56_007167 [Rhizobium mongolense]|uniref:Uncharacterized protein n=2 Tax=Rhizobium mongolense TaxID=57676 RepID=A0ABR6IZB1_9HYPH|nr:hypothetical protein [Rhizobium mongolense]TVZ75293.1 hypothetical protein BCL32_0777 [Rhizobium mongolense USDA 1844]